MQLKCSKQYKFWVQLFMNVKKKVYIFAYAGGMICEHAFRSSSGEG